MRRISNLSWQSIYTYIGLSILILFVGGCILAFLISEVNHRYLENDLLDKAVTLRQMTELSEAVQTGDGEFNAIADQIERLTGAQVALLGPDGSQLEPSSQATDTAAKVPGPEMRAAINGEIGINHTRRESEVATSYLAIPIQNGEELLGVLHLTVPTPRIAETTRNSIRWIVIVFLVLAVAATVTLVMQSKKTSEGLSQLDLMVDRITQGDLSARVHTLQSGELGHLALSLNRMADRLQSQTRKRRREKDRLNTVLRTMNDGIIILTRSGVVRSMNPAAARILDVSLRQSHKKSFVQVARDYRIAAVWKKCLETNQEQAATIEYSIDSSIHIVITPFLKRRARGYLVMIQDLSQLRYLQTVRQDFVSNVSHELRTPLASLRALVETLRDGALEDPPAAARFLERMEIEVDSLTQMVQELMELSRIESGRVPLQLELVRPLDIVLPAIERLQMQATRAGVDLDVDINEALPNVLADTERAQQVVTNLVHNAIKFTPDGGVVVLRANSEADMVRITVRDSGIGIAAEELERVFERFFKADPSRTQGGTGLGLSVASHIVQAHGGEIWADSVEGEWSEFGFSLPVATEDALPIDDSHDVTGKDEVRNNAVDPTL